MVLAQARMETRLLLRNGEQLLLAVVIPLIVLVGGIAAARHFDLTFSHSPVDTLTPGMLALAVMSTSFTSLAIATGFERRYGVLKRLGSSPLPRSGLLAGKVGALLVVEALQLVRDRRRRRWSLGWSPALSAPACSARSLLRAARHRGVRVARPAAGRRAAGRGDAGRGEPGLPAAAGRRRGGVPAPARTAAPAPCSRCCRPAPSARACARRSPTPASPSLPLLVLAAWAAVGTFLTARTFRWE